MAIVIDNPLHGGHSEPEVPVKEVDTFAALALKAGMDRGTSSAKSIKVYNDTAASVFDEAWAALTNWVLPATPGWQVSAGRMFSTAQGGGSGGCRGISLAADENLRAVYHYRRVGAGSSGQIIIGVSNNTASTAPASAASQAFGLNLPVQDSTDIGSWNLGVNTAQNGQGQGALTAGDYVVTLTIDALYISVTMRKVDGTTECCVRRLRSGFSCNNLYIFNSDSRQLTGDSVGLINYRKSLSSMPTINFSEGLTHTGQWTGDGTNNFTISLPKTYDSRVPSPVAIMVHGNGTTETMWWLNGTQKVVSRALLDAGYIVVGASFGGSSTTWGNASSQAAYKAAYRYARDNYNIGAAVMYGQSMGGIEALNILASGAVPGIAALALTVPTYSLGQNYSNPSFTDVITGAYGISGDYASKTKGFDPALFDNHKFFGVPLYLVVATDDASVSPNENGLSLYYKSLTWSRSSTLVSTTGGHSVSLSGFTAGITSFFDGHAR